MIANNKKTQGIICCQRDIQRANQNSHLIKSLPASTDSTQSGKSSAAEAKQEVTL